jgi:hypothetical protein
VGSIQSLSVYCNPSLSNQRLVVLIPLLGLIAAQGGGIVLGNVTVVENSVFVPGHSKLEKCLKVFRNVSKILILEQVHEVFS